MELVLIYAILFLVGACASKPPITEDYSEEEAATGSIDSLLPKHGTLFVENDRSESETILRTILIHNAVYDRRSGPRLADGQAINVSVSISLRNIMEISDLKGFIALNAEMGFKWYDTRIQWKPSSFSNLTVVPVRDDDIYHPDILLLNSFSAKESRVFASSMALLHNDGKVLWYPRATLKTRCTVDAQAWPFTAMECDFKFGSPVLNDYDVRLYLHTNAIYVRSYMDNHQWRLVGGGQFMVPENWEDLRKKYGDELPWIRLYFQHRPNRFLISIFAVPTTVLALAGLLFACVEDVRINALLGVCEVLLLTGLHLAITQLVPTCENAPLFVILLSHGSVLLVGLLFASFMVEYLRNKRTNPPRAVALAARISTHCKNYRPAPDVLTFVDSEDVKVKFRHTWRTFAAFIKCIVVLMYFSCAFTLSLICLFLFIEKLGVQTEMTRMTLNGMRPDW